MQYQILFLTPYVNHKFILTFSPSVLQNVKPPVNISPN